MQPFKRPIIGIPADVKQVGEHPYNAVGNKYIDAIVNIANCTPILLPALGCRQDLTNIIGLIDGLFLTGSKSNVEPSRYGHSLLNSDTYLDQDRDATTFPLIEAMLNAKKPLLGVCRGFQELNVAMGGTLHQSVHQQANLMDHREKDGSLEVQYGPSHIVKLAKNGRLFPIFAQKEEITVNSVHDQGINQLGQNLTVEATAPDGLIEAISVTNAQQFAIAVQWHPEWKALDNPLSVALFSAFGSACNRN
jgi:putative glutamine amidotransferase